MEADPSLYLIARLSDRHTSARAAFSCGVPPLDRYLREQAGQDARRRVAATFVLTQRHSPAILGYYTLCATSIDVGDLPPETAKKFPRYPRLPATLIGRLAVDRRYRGQRLGEHLLMDALRRSLENSAAIGSMAVVVDAKDEAARNFYLQYEFIPFPESPQRLFLPMKSLEQLFKTH